MKIVKPIIVSIIVWGILLVIDVAVTYVNMNSVGGAGDLLRSAFSGRGLQKTSLMGVVFSMNGMSLSFRFFVVFILFIGIGICLFNRNLLYQKLKSSNLIK